MRTRPKFLNIAIIIVTILVTSLLVAQPVFAQVTPTVDRVLQDNSYEQNLFGDLPSDVRAKLGQPCTQSGIFPAAIKAFLKIVGFSSSKVKTYTDLCNVRSLESTTTTSTTTDTTNTDSMNLTPNQDLVDAFYKTDNPGFGALLIQGTTTIIDQRPASGVLYLAEQVDKLTTPDSVYAATKDPASYYPGLGYSLLYPIRDFWGWAVTISFSFMVLIILVVAFGLLFRARLGGKDVVRLENAIPGIVLAMILIPLSYPISGLFIDGITLGTNVVHDVLFSQAGPARMVYEEKIDPDLTGISADQNRGLYADDPRVTVLNIRDMIKIDDVTKLLQNACDDSNTCNSANFGGTTILGTVDQIVKMVNVGGNSQGVDGLLGDIISFIFSIIFLITCIKIFFQLFKKYLILLLFPVISPFFFAMVALPGRGTKQVMDFIKIMGNAALQFIVVYAIFLIGIILTSDSFRDAFFPATAKVSGYIPPLLDRNIISILGASSTGADVGSFFIIIGAILLLAIPGILASMDKTFKVEGSNPLVAGALKELRTNADIGFRQVPLATANVLSKAGQSSIAGLNAARNALRRPGAPTVEEEGQSAGLRRESLAQRQLDDAKNSNGPGRAVRIAAAQANLAAVKAQNRVLGQEPTKLDTKAEFKVEFSDPSSGKDIGSVLTINRNAFYSYVNGSITRGGVTYTPKATGFSTAAGAMDGYPLEIKLSSGQRLPAGEVELEEQDASKQWKVIGKLGDPGLSTSAGLGQLIKFKVNGGAFAGAKLYLKNAKVKVDSGSDKVKIEALLVIPSGNIAAPNDSALTDNKVRFKIAGLSSKDVDLKINIT